MLLRIRASSTSTSVASVTWRSNNESPCTSLSCKTINGTGLTCGSASAARNAANSRCSSCSSSRYSCRSSSDNTTARDTASETSRGLSDSVPVSRTLLRSCSSMACVQFATA
ncbi:hypothetical protein Vafri_1595 [Volvox africanus]|nr:hypothetical protein Vafri_1595 [Volvox africanus]